MPTLVRVRGKRRPRGEGAPASKHRKTQPLSSDRVEKESKPQELAQLELLPTEILQNIFLFGTNLELPLASPVLWQKVTSEHVKIELVIKFFSWMRSTRGRSLDDRVQLCYGAEDYVSSDHPEAHRPDVAQTQSALLRKKWLTYPLFRKCQWLFFIRQATRQLGHFMGGKVPDQRREMAAMEQQLGQYFERWQNVKMSPTNLNEIRGEYFYTRNDGMVFSAYMGLHYGDCGTLEISVDNQVWTAEKEQVLGSIGARENLQLTFPRPEQDMEVPTKLYRKPWTQERGDFLMLLIDNNCENRKLRFDYQAKEDALHDAIEEQCCPAIRLLLLDSKPNMFDSWKQPNCAGLEETFHLYPIRSEFAKSEKFREFSDVPPGAQPWTVLKGKPLEDTLLSEITCGVSPRFSHLMHSLDVAIKREDDGFELFRWLTSSAKNHSSHRSIQSIYTQAQFSHDEVRRAILERIGRDIKNGVEDKQTVNRKALRWFDSGEYQSSTRNI